MTQTTSERIEAMLGVHYDWTGRVIEAGVDTAARKIAAEIDALRDEMAVILRERNDAHLALAERTRERDEALAEVATLTLKLANARLNLKHCSEEVDKRDECAGQLAESRAEVESCRKAYAQMRSTEDEWKRDTLAALKAEAERLRPAAEAWRTLEDFREAERTGTLSDEKRTRKIHETARDAARAAKERNP